MNIREDTAKKLLVCAILLLVALASALIIAQKATDVGTHAATLNSIDDKSETVLKLSAGSALVSAAVTMFPGDMATPVAEKLADFTEYFLLILCVLYTEKYLVTILGAAVFRIVIPICCVLFGVGMFRRPKVLYPLAAKLAVIALALYFVIPLSLRLSDMVYRSYEATVQETISSAQDLTQKTAPLSEANEDQGLIASALERIKETAGTLTDKAAATLNRFVETLAVMIVTSCVIPLLVLFFFLWVVKQLTGYDAAARALRRLKKKAGGADEPDNAADDAPDAAKKD